LKAIFEVLEGSLGTGLHGIRCKVEDTKSCIYTFAKNLKLLIASIGGSFLAIKK